MTSGVLTYVPSTLKKNSHYGNNQGDALNLKVHFVSGEGNNCTSCEPFHGSSLVNKLCCN